MADPSHSNIFEKAIHVTPIDSQTYSAHLDANWCIGQVPHGGYTASILYRAAAIHFKNHHGARVKSTPEPIGLQISYLRRTAIGPALITVQDMKIGARISTVHVTLSQRPDGAVASDRIDKKDGVEVKVVAYLTISPPETEMGPACKGSWGLEPAPIFGSLPDGSVDLQALAKNGEDGQWARYPRVTQSAAPKNLEIYGPRRPSPSTLASRTKQVVEQWARFTPGGTEARWSNEALLFLIDMFPAALDRMAAMELSRMQKMQELQGKAPESVATKGLFWYPTVTMNIDLKTKIPSEGVEWLYSRIVTRSLRGSRADLEVVILDQKGELVATSSQVALVVDASRNYKGRQGAGKL
ncbi:hypothetical protein ARAM_002840 [Aspergillus rambellii]|uniref:Thioesterase family protein n=1 Tax=Aspergillus rambellii TaxID=308745 RepID=A0A0F8WUF1_9EURO|nr:hypothetical protein ARAM_002840 [Aspergillus rambellii]